MMGQKKSQSKDGIPAVKQNLEDYEPGATQAQILKALKKVAKAKPSRKPS